MRERRFVQTDVFASRPTKGNGLAVVLDGEGLSDAEMQGFAAWTNLAETTFLLPPTDPHADYRVRIFTPSKEMQFAGHPTLGSCAAWRHAGGVPRNDACIVQECAIGLVDIDVTGHTPAFVAPETRISLMPPETVSYLCSELRIAPSLVKNATLLENGPSWQLLELQSANDVLAIDSSTVRWPDHVGVSVLGAHGADTECDFEIRNLSPSSGMSEDPITGSLNAAVAKWLNSQGRLSRDLVIAQGTAIGREGRVSVRKNGDRVLIGGQTTIVIEGSVWL